MRPAQRGIDRIGGNRIGEGGDVARLDQPPGLSLVTRLVLPVARAAITGTPDAIASSVTLPKVSVIDGLSSMSMLATARPSSA